MKKDWRGAGRVAGVALGAAIAVAAVTLAILALRPAPEGIPVWVTTAQVPFGAVIEDNQLSLVVVPNQAVPANAFGADSKPDRLVADRLLPAGTTLGEDDVRGSERTRMLQSGETLLEIPVPTGSTLSLQTGESVDLWGQAEDCGDKLCAPERVAESARVLQVTETDSPAWGGEPETLVALAAPSESTAAILRAESNGTLQYALRAAAPD